MKNLTIPFTEDFQFQSYANEQLNSTQYFAIGTYNGNNYAFNIAGQLKSQIEASVPIGCVNECYLCVPATANIGTCYVDSFATSDTSMAIWEDDYFKIPLFDHMNTDENSADYGAVLASVYCPDATTFAMLQPNLAWLEVEVFGFQLQVPNNELHVYKKDDTLDLSKVHVSPKAIFTNADGQPEEVELERSSYSLSLTSEGAANYLNVSYLNQTVQKTISLHVYKDLFYDPDKDESVSIYDNDNSPAPLKMDIYFPAIPESSPCKLTFNAVITLHGGGWSSCDRTDYAHHTQRITDNGLVCVNMDYSLLGSANIPNDITPCVKMLGDIGSAIIKVKTKMSERGLELGKVALMGYSAGGHLALMYGLLNPYNATDKTGISLIVAEGAPTYFTKYDLHAVDSGFDNSDSLYITVPEQHNQMATNIRVMAGVDRELSETIETSCWQIRAISPADLPDNNKYEDFADAGGKILLAYGKENSGAFSDGLIPYSRGERMEDKFAEYEGTCVLKTIIGCSHEDLCDNEDLEIYASFYLTELNSILASFSKTSDA